MDQIGSPYTVVMTNPALTITDVMEAEFSGINRELHKHFSGSSPYPSGTLGNDDTSLTFKTTDRAAIATLIKGMEVGSVQVKYKSVVTHASAVTPTFTQDDFEISVTISPMRVTESVKISNDSEKKPAEFEITLQPFRKVSDGSDPTFTLSLAETEGDGDPDPDPDPDPT